MKTWSITETNATISGAWLAICLVESAITTDRLLHGTEEAVVCVAGAVLKVVDICNSDQEAPGKAVM